ncbi:MAG: lipopolysaccharide kinase InaA family protein [Rikenellaceae bacterium]|nr:lipopolysaccharide kinase InaA family protein [Rikenellaceae bacterium]
MKVEIYINPKYCFLRNFIEKIPGNFDDLGVATHLGRNHIRIVEVDGRKLVIKYFKKITTVNRLIYGNVRKSKAKRSYENSLKLLKNGIGTPEPVGYIDTYNRFSLQKSFYICLFSDYKDIKEILSKPLSESEEGMRAFARLTSKMHHSGIYHGDYNLSNVLYKYDGEKYDFCLIDNNRMKFKHFSLGAGVKNLKRMKLSVEQMAIIGSEYAKVSHLDSNQVVIGMIFFRKHFASAANFKVSAKKFIKGLFK